MPQQEDEVQEKLLNCLSLADEIKTNQIRPARDQFFGEFLHAIAVGYFDQLNAHETRYSATMGVVSHRLPSFGFAQTKAKAIELFGASSSFNPQGIMLDMNHLMKIASAKDGDRQQVKDYQFICGVYGSGLEHSVLEQIFSTPQNPFEGISTVKILSLANSSNFPIYTITSENVAAILPNLLPRQINSAQFPWV